jgi:hypothetical protein
MISDKEYRRDILQGLNKGESKNSLSRDLRYARRGIIREKDPDQLLSVATALNLVVLCISLWNTVQMQRIIRTLLREKYIVTKEDLNYLSPFIHEHINIYGQFSFHPIPKSDPLAMEREFKPILEI